MEPTRTAPRAAALQVEPAKTAPHAAALQGGQRCLRSRCALGAASGVDAASAPEQVLARRKVGAQYERRSAEEFEDGQNRADRPDEEIAISGVKGGGAIWILQIWSALNALTRAAVRQAPCKDKAEEAARASRCTLRTPERDTHRVRKVYSALTLGTEGVQKRAETGVINRSAQEPRG